MEHMVDKDKNVSSAEDVNNTRGGARPGAGRKKSINPLMISRD